MKYLSIDIETTGLDPQKHDMIEFAAVLDDTLSASLANTPVTDLPYFRAVIVRDTYCTGAYCAALHHDLWKEIRSVNMDQVKHGEGYVGWWSPKRDSILQVKNDAYKCLSNGDLRLREGVSPLTHYLSPECLHPAFIDWLCDNGVKESIIPAGKNFGSFDLQFIKVMPILNNQPLGHRSLDVGSMYFGQKDTEIPSLFTDSWPFSHRTFDPGSLYYQVGDNELPSLSKCLERAGFSSVVAHTALEDALDVIRILRFKFKNDKESK